MNKRTLMALSLAALACVTSGAAMAQAHVTRIIVPRRSARRQRPN